MRRRAAVAASLLLLAAAAVAQPTVCPPPTDLRADSVFMFSARVQFAGAADARGYQVTTIPATSTYPLPAGQTSVQLRGLTYSIDYTVEIVQQCATGEYSAAARLRLPAAAYCSGPNDVQPVNITATSAGIIFGPGAPGEARDYTVAVDLIEPGVGSTEVGRYTVTSSPLQLTGLLPNTLYSVTFYTNCTDGQTSGGTGGAGLPFRTLPATTTATAAASRGQAMVLYPNPARNAVQLQLPASAPLGEYTLQLLDATGRVVQTQAVRCPADRRLRFALLPGPAGLYMLRAQGPGNYLLGAPLLREQ